MKLRIQFKYVLVRSLAQPNPQGPTEHPAIAETARAPSDSSHGSTVALLKRMDVFCGPGVFLHICRSTLKIVCWTFLSYVVDVFTCSTV